MDQTNKATTDSSPEMTAWVEEGPDKVLPKRKNLRSLFRDDDCAYGLTTISDLKESLISDEAREDARAQSRLESGNNKLQPGVLVQALQSWTCSSQRSLTVVIPEEKSRHENNQDYSNVEFSTLVVREGDCLSEISRLVRVPIHVLQRVNSIANIESLKVKMKTLFHFQTLNPKPKTVSPISFHFSLLANSNNLKMVSIHGLFKERLSLMIRTDML